jgi:hypothetical protein
VDGSAAPAAVVEVDVVVVVAVTMVVVVAVMVVVVVAVAGPPAPRGLASSPSFAWDESVAEAEAGRKAALGVIWRAASGVEGLEDDMCFGEVGDLSEPACAVVATSPSPVGAADTAVADEDDDVDDNDDEDEEEEEEETVVELSTAAEETATLTESVCVPAG